MTDAGLKVGRLAGSPFSGSGLHATAMSAPLANVWNTMRDDLRAAVKLFADGKGSSESVVIWR